MDEMTVVGQDGKPKYKLSTDNNITDLRNVCSCPKSRPKQFDGEQLVCLVCGLQIK